MSGPISLSGSSPGPTLIVGDALGDRVDQRRRPTSPTATTTEMAMQRSPAEP